MKNCKKLHIESHKIYKGPLESVIKMQDKTPAYTFTHSKNQMFLLCFIVLFSFSPDCLYLPVLPFALAVCACVRVCAVCLILFVENLSTNEVYLKQTRKMNYTQKLCEKGKERQQWLAVVKVGDEVGNGERVKSNT